MRLLFIPGGKVNRPMGRRELTQRILPKIFHRHYNVTVIVVRGRSIRNGRWIPEASSTSVDGDILHSHIPHYGARCGP